MTLKTLATAACITLAVSVAPVTTVTAATLLVDEDGLLTGATGITVGDALFDVEFLDGTCAELFTGCDQTSDFAFQTADDAVLAGLALLDQVLIDGLNRGFDSFPELTRGISIRVPGFFDSNGNIEVPYGLEFPGNGFTQTQITTIRVINGGSDDLDTLRANFLSTSFDSSSDPSVFAVFSPTVGVAPVPLPAAGWLLLAGLGGIAALKRRKKPDA